MDELTDPNLESNYTEGMDKKGIMKDVALTLWVNSVNLITHSLPVFIPEIRGSKFFSSISMLLGMLMVCPFANAGESALAKPDGKSAAFVLQDPNRELSPFTGMGRKQWTECGRFILAGAFQHVKSIEDPMLFPKVPGVSYPQKGYENCSPEERSAAIFEGVARTFNIAAPLLLEDPDLTLHGIKVADYYRYQLLQLTNPKCPYFIGDGAKNDGPQQQTCELGNLALWMMLAPDALWNKLAPAEKDQIAGVMQGWSSGWTKTHNWRWFNVMMMTFLKKNGYKINEALMLNHLDHLLMLESGEGWFRDQSHDYYTAHVFQLYGSLWNRFYGWEHEPARAAVIDHEFARFMKNYPDMFGRRGEINMWGRSILYRMGGSAALSAAFVRGRDPQIDAGFARRLASGALLQFVTRPEFFQNGVPSLGFYGHFEPAIQPYSCAASPFWMFMNFTALTLPESDPFWSATENEGFWPSLGKKNKVTFLPGAGILFVNHGSTGATDLVNGKVHNSDPSYCRLTYNTEFPWESNSVKGATAAQISLMPLETGKGPEFPESVNLAGFRDGVYYRQMIFKKDKRGGAPCYVDMAEIPIPDGMISIRRFRKVSPAVLYEGHFGMPDLAGGAKSTEREMSGKHSIILAIPGRQLAITNFLGWDTLGVVEHHGQNPEIDKSHLLFVSREDKARYGAPELLISVMLHRTDDNPWTDDELQPIARIEALVPDIPMHLGGLRVVLKSGESHVVDFTGIDGSSSR